MSENKEKEQAKKEVKVSAGTFRGSLYSQIVGITVTDFDITLEFAYVNPRSGQGEVVSRVTLPKKAGEELSKSIIETIKKHNQKKGK